MVFQYQQRMINLTLIRVDNPDKVRHKHLDQMFNHKG